MTIIPEAGRLLLGAAIAAAGGAAFSAAGLPAPWLSGPAASVAAASVAGVAVTVPGWLRHAALVFLGATMGAAVTPDTLALLARWPVSLFGLALSVLAIMTASSFYLERVHGYDRATARLAAVPGALPYVLALAAESRADQRRVAIVQAVRLAALLVALPSVLSLLGYTAATPAAAGPAAAPVRLPEVAMLIGGGLAGSWLFARLGAPAAPLFGSMVAGALLYGSGTLGSAIPGWLLLPGFAVVGATVGSNFGALERSLLADTLTASLGSLLVGAAMAALAMLPVAWLLAVPPAQVWLAYAPGGVDVMTIMAIALGLDPAFVGGHHVVRFLALGLLLPLWLRKELPARNAGAGR